MSAAKVDAEVFESVASALWVRTKFSHSDIGYKSKKEKEH